MGDTKGPKWLETFPNVAGLVDVVAFACFHVLRRAIDNFRARIFANSLRAFVGAGR